jgi:hypothetical protein
MHHQVKEIFEEELAKCSGRLSDRKAIAYLILKNKALYHYTLEKITTPHSPNIQRLCWSLDIAFLESPLYFREAFSYIVKGLCIQNKDSCLRSLMKICAAMSQNPYYFSKIKQAPQKSNSLVERALELLTEPHEVAVQVYAMETLFRWRHEFKWIKEHLANLIESQMEWKTAAYKARGKRLLKILKKESPSP